jgi:hypothetical protein
VRCEPERVLSISQSKKWQALFHDMKVGGSTSFRVAEGVDDFALLFVLRTFHFFDGKSEWNKKKAWPIDEYMRIALFCSRYGVERREICDALLKKDSLEEAIQIDRRHGGSILDTDWLTVAWVFRWDMSFKLMWKFLVATSKFTEQGHMTYAYYDYDSPAGDLGDAWRNRLYDEGMDEVTIIFGVCVDHGEDDGEVVEEGESSASGNSSSNSKDYMYDEDWNLWDPLLGDMPESEGEIKGYFPRAVYENIVSTRAKYLNRLLDMVYGLLNALLSTKIRPGELFSHFPSQQVLEREECLRNMSGALVRGLITIDLPLVRPDAASLRHLSIRDLYRRLKGIPYVDLGDLPRDSESDSDLRAIWDVYFDKIRGLLDGIHELPDAFEEYLQRPFQPGPTSRTGFA